MLCRHGSIAKNGKVTPGLKSNVFDKFEWYVPVPMMTCAADGRSQLPTVTIVTDCPQLHHLLLTNNAMINAPRSTCVALGVNLDPNVDSSIELRKAKGGWSTLFKICTRTPLNQHV